MVSHTSELSDLVPYHSLHLWVEPVSRPIPLLNFDNNIQETLYA
jgi:hypothetical protein